MKIDFRSKVKNFAKGFLKKKTFFSPWKSRLRQKVLETVKPDNILYGGSINVRLTSWFTG